MRVDLWLSTWMISIIIICSELKYFARHCPVYLSQVQSNDFLSFVWYPIMIKKSDAIAESNSLEKLQRMRNHIPLLSWQTEHFLPFLLQSEDCTCRTFFRCYVSLWANQCFMSWPYQSLVASSLFWQSILIVLGQYFTTKSIHCACIPNF